jgi:ribosomal protein S18 acetylase RimI-like enzyme
VVWVDTFKFQAPGFYQKLGYEVFGVLPDYPRGRRCFFLHKRFRQSFAGKRGAGLTRVERPLLSPAMRVIDALDALGLALVREMVSMISFSEFPMRAR